MRLANGPTALIPVNKRSVNRDGVDVDMPVSIDKRYKTVYVGVRSIGAKDVIGRYNSGGRALVITPTDRATIA
jgi:hypothetical protein